MAKFIEIDGDVVNVEHIVALLPTGDGNVYSGILILSNEVNRNILSEADFTRAKRTLLALKDKEGVLKNE